MTETTKWLRVSRRKPCVICGRPDWCGVSADGAVACCMRTESPKPTANGGWLHKLTNDPAPRPRPTSRPTAKPVPQVTVNWPDIAARYQLAINSDQLARLSLDLGLSIASLHRLGIGWAGAHRAWSFPMMDASGEVVGIRLRSEAGRKWCIPGSSQGLFIADGCVGDQCDLVIICEGPTDTAAVLDLGFYAIGRPSCSGCHEPVIELGRGRNVVILSDRDDVKTRDDGSQWRPGQEGSARLAAALQRPARSLKIIYPLKGKDARAWKQAGATPAIVRAVIANAKFWRPQ